MKRFELVSDFKPMGDQPEAIDKLCDGLSKGKKALVLLGITGSGKTFTMANVIQRVQKPTLILAHNKTLAAQLYQEFKSFFPHNAVEYFVSYYDYYQPEAYIARTDTYIEKDLAINDEIDKMRLSATRSLLERQDVLIVASVSCIYGLGMPEFYAQMNLELVVGRTYRRDEILLRLVEMHYKRNDFDLVRATFRVRGEVIEIFAAYEEKRALRLEFNDDLLIRLSEIDPLTGRVIERIEHYTLYAGSHFVTPADVRARAIQSIKAELEERLAFFEREGKLLERERLHSRTTYDLEMIQEIGFCKGVENYSRHFSNRLAGSPPACLLNYFPEDFLLFIDESHQTIPQIHSMYHGDRSRKEALVEYGFRLPSAYDNRPLRFEEAYACFHQVIYVSATPSKWEVEEAKGEIVEQILRPTGLLDPSIEVRAAEFQVDDVIEEIRKETEKKGRVLVTTLTKRLSEELAEHLTELGIKTKYLHSDIDTLERIQILRDLREGLFDVLVGINLLREGLDLPEVTLVAILDADKEGFLRSETSLIQTCGRAARNANGRVIMYADKMTSAIKNTLDITSRRRLRQMAYNQKMGITPKTIQRELPQILGTREKTSEEKRVIKRYVSSDDVEKKIREYEKKMKAAAADYQFEEAAKWRDLMREYEMMEIRFGR